MIYSGLAGVSVMDVLAGKASLKEADPKGGKGLSLGERIRGAAPLLNPSGQSPKQIIDTVVIPLAQKHGINVTPESVAAANARHGPTITGGRSDHQGPPNVRWAVDADGTLEQEDAFMADVARTFNIEWDGSGLVNGNWMGYRVQLIHRTMIGGNHFTHGHVGIEKL